MLNAKTSPIPAAAEPATNKLGTLKPVNASVTEAIIYQAPSVCTALYLTVWYGYFCSTTSLVEPWFIIILYGPDDPLSVVEFCINHILLMLLGA